MRTLLTHGVAERVTAEQFDLTRVVCALLDGTKSGLNGLGEGDIEFSNATRRHTPLPNELRRP